MSLAREPPPRLQRIWQDYAAWRCRFSQRPNAISPSPPGTPRRTRATPAPVAAATRGRQPSCPPQRTPLRTVSKSPRAASVLVPSGVQEVLLCRYFSDNVMRAKQGRLARSKLITRHSIVESLTSEFDHLEALPNIHHHCPRDPGAVQINVIFIYPHTASDVVTVRLRDRCYHVSNGRLHQEFRLTRSLRRRLLRTV